MPFTSISELPARIKKFSTKLQRQWMAVFNTTFEKVFKETNDRKQAERRAFMAANSVLKKRFKKGQNLNNDSHKDYMNMLVNSFLGNLKG